MSDDSDPFLSQLKPARDPIGFTKAQAHGLVGRGLTKKIVTEENPAVAIGQSGTVIRAEPSALHESFAVVVDWGDREIWTYDDWADFSKDTDITPTDPI